MVKLTFKTLRLWNLIVGLLMVFMAAIIFGITGTQPLYPHTQLAVRECMGRAEAVSVSVSGMAYKAAYKLKCSHRDCCLQYDQQAYAFVARPLQAADVAKIPMYTNGRSTPCVRHRAPARGACHHILHPCGPLGSSARMCLFTAW